MTDRALAVLLIDAENLTPARRKWLWTWLGYVMEDLEKKEPIGSRRTCLMPDPEWERTTDPNDYTR